MLIETDNKGMTYLVSIQIQTFCKKVENENI